MTLYFHIILLHCFLLFSIPVIITVLIRAEMSSSSTGFVSSFNWFSKISNPRNTRSDSTLSLNDWTEIAHHHPSSGKQNQNKDKSLPVRVVLTLIQAPFLRHWMCAGSRPDRKGMCGHYSNQIKRKRVLSKRFILMFVENKLNYCKGLYNLMCWFSLPHLLATTREEFYLWYKVPWKISEAQEKYKMSVFLETDL